MKKFTLLSLILAMNAAYADKTWTGFYAGVNGGFAANDAQLNSQQLGFTNPNNTCNTNANYSTFFPGVQLGYLYQLPSNYVTGVEANVTVNTNQTQTLNCDSNFNSNVYDGFTFRNQMQISIKGRLGRALDWNKNSILPYLTVGANFTQAGLTYKNEGGDYYSDNSISQAGWLIGAGIEWAFRQHWSVRAEYYYIDVNAINLKLPNVYGLIDPSGNATINLNSNNIALSLNYWL